MPPIILLATVLAFVGVYLPSPHDKDGIGLRVHNLSACGCYFLGESLSHVRFDVTLLNHSKKTFKHDPFVVAKRSHELVVRVYDPNGKVLVPLVPRHAFERPPFTVQSELRPGQTSSLNFEFKEFGWLGLTKPGRHQVEATWTIGGRKFTSPPAEFEVVAVPPSAVLVSHAIPLEGPAVKQARRPVIQQVLVGNRTLLIYRGHYNPSEPGGGGMRLAELPGKCEMTVEGATGDGKPLTITYRTSPTAEPTKLVINSSFGSPWADEEQRHLEYRLGIAPAPPPAKK